MYVCYHKIQEFFEKANPFKDTPAMPQWSDDDGLMEWLQGANYLTFYGDDNANYILECNYCPKCGKKIAM